MELWGQHYLGFLRHWDIDTNFQKNLNLQSTPFVEVPVLRFNCVYLSITVTVFVIQVLGFSEACTSKNGFILYILARFLYCIFLI